MEVLQPSAPCEVFTLQSHEIPSNWWWIEPLLMECDDPGWTAGDVRSELMTRGAQLWGARYGSSVLGVWITKIENTRSLRWGLVWIAAGKPLEVGLALYRKYTEPWFLQQGCLFVQIIGRKGWKKALPDYEERGVVLIKRFKDEQIIGNTDEHYH